MPGSRLPLYLHRLSWLLGYHGCLRRTIILTNNKQTQLRQHTIVARAYSMAGGTVLMDGHGNEKLFDLEDTLPSLPVPPLDKTLQRYLASVKPVVTAEEYQQTEKIVADFERGEGKDLQEKLLKKAKSSKNWLEKWWEEKAYMEVRAPAAVLCNIVGTIPCHLDIWPPQEGTQLQRAAIITWHILQYYLCIRREEIPIDRSRDGKTVWSMHQMRGLFCTGRQPGIERDTLHRHFKTESEGPGPNHIVVFCNGHIFVQKPFSESGELLSSHEFYRQYSYIKEQSHKTRGQGIGALSADDRTTYAKAYNSLCKLDPANARHLKTIESSIFVVQLQDGSPQNTTELYRLEIFGPNVHNRFFDKSYGLLVYDNGTIGANSDHAPADGIVIVNHFQYVHQALIKTAGAWQVGHLWNVTWFVSKRVVYGAPLGAACNITLVCLSDTTKGSSTVDPDLPMPEELTFIVDSHVIDDIAHATETYNKNASNVESLHVHIQQLEESSNADMLHCENSLMGKKWIRAQGLHPDAFVQLALQYTYYHMYNKPAPTYESATTRKFYHGRTETIRSCTTEAINWCKAMLDKSTSNADRVDCFKKAHNKHLQLLKECSNAEGCDRHLLGLLAIAQEESKATPQLYTDPAFTRSGGGGNFVLSTSLTGYVGVHGVTMAMTHNGYGIFYCFSGENSILINLTAFKTCPETDVNRFFAHLNASLVDMQKMLTPPKM